ncbi:DUF3617 domain-containing protein [Alloalcanivorax sp. C16-2]|uniref:DUF3617 domain-containing protein n=1 Tax=Alloalcanivorax TaxID=3020832 RepID=UPI001933066B|nr:DUF3617 family protein [Alloalcanivorax marinus]MBL7250945.1 DUF3617 family protein [Alloalcanivorax marinus]
MKKTSITLAFALAVLSGPALAADLKPGKWEVKQRAVGDQVPPGMDQEKTRTRCVTAKEAEDIEKTLRQNWLRNGCKSPETEWDGDTLEWSTQCQAGERTLDSSGTMTVKDDEHYTTEITTGTPQGGMTIKAEARWTGPCDS